MTDEQRKRVHAITYSTDSREELAERIVKLEDEGLKLRVRLCESYKDADQMEAKEKQAVGENAKLREMVSRSQADLESELDCAEQMEAREETYKEENERLRRVAEACARAFESYSGCDFCPYVGECYRGIIPGSCGCRLYDDMRELGLVCNERQ